MKKKLMCLFIGICLIGTAGCSNKTTEETVTARAEEVARDELKYRFPDFPSLKLSDQKDTIINERDFTQYGDSELYTADVEGEVEGIKFSLSIDFDNDEVKRFNYEGNSTNLQEDVNNIKQYMYDIYGNPERVDDDGSIVWYVQVDSTHFYSIVLQSYEDNGSIHITITKKIPDNAETMSNDTEIDYKDKYGDAADEIKGYDEQLKEIEEQKESIQGEIDKILK